MKKLIIAAVAAVALSGCAMKVDKFRVASEIRKPGTFEKLFADHPQMHYCFNRPRDELKKDGQLLLESMAFGPAYRKQPEMMSQENYKAYCDELSKRFLIEYFDKYQSDYISEGLPKDKQLKCLDYKLAVEKNKFELGLN